MPTLPGDQQNPSKNVLVSLLICIEKYTICSRMYYLKEPPLGWSADAHHSVQVKRILADAGPGDSSTGCGGGGGGVRGGGGAGLEG